MPTCTQTWELTKPSEEYLFLRRFQAIHPIPFRPYLLSMVVAFVLARLKTMTPGTVPLPTRTQYWLLL
jgi:hypothetical protein